MDIFMDKLAQRATAQEIIQANTAADVEELNRLKNQVGEYNECLVRLQKLIDDGMGRLEGMQSEDHEVRRLVKESMEGIKALRGTAESLEQCQKKLLEQVGAMDKAAVSRTESMSRSMEEGFGRIEVMGRSVEEGIGLIELMGRSAEEGLGRIEVMGKAMEEKLDRMEGLTEAQLTEKLNALEENVHKECVKVYRNVQAVVTEESGRQGEALAEARKEIAAMKGRQGTALGFSLAAAIMALAGVVLQVLAGLGVLPF